VPARLRSGTTFCAAGALGEGDGRAVDVARGVGRGDGGLLLPGFAAPGAAGWD